MRRGDGRAAGASARTVQEVELRAHVRARAAGRASRATRAAATHPVRQAERLHDKTGGRANGRLRARGRRGKKLRGCVRRVESNATKGPRASSPRRGSSGVSRARGRRAAKKRSGAQRFAGKYRRRAFRRRATPRASTTRRDGERPTRGTRDIVTLASRAGAFVGGIGRRTGANLATEGGQLAGAAAQKRRPADGIRAGDARGGGGLLSRARGGVADARTRENGRRQGCHVRNARRVDGRARWMCCQSSGEKRGDLNKGASNTLPQDRRENHSQLFYDWIPIRKIFPPNHRVLRQRAPNCPVLSDVSAVGGATFVSSHGMHSFSSARFASRGGHPPHATPGAAFISADAGDARRRPGGCTVGDRGIVTRVVRAPRSRRV